MYESRRACPELVERGRHNAQPGWAIGLKSFISAPRELVPLRRQPINKQPESCSAKLASKHSTSYIVKKQGDPLIWTALECFGRVTAYRTELESRGYVR